jgi:hypothetical protein
MSKMGSHGSFGHLKHKLWPKERSGVKLAVWLLTTKSRESTRFPYVQVAHNMPLKSYWLGLQLWLKHHYNCRSTHKVMRAQSCGSPNIDNFKTPIWVSQDKKKTIRMWASRRGAEYTIWGKVMASPEFGLWWILGVRGHPWFVLTPKVFQLCTNHLVLVCASPCN